MRRTGARAQGRAAAVLAVLVGCCEGLELARTSCGSGSRSGGPGLGPRTSGRRSVLLGAPLALCWRPGAACAAESYESLATRLRQPVVQEVGENPTSGAEPPLPAWMVGRWRCEQTLTSFTMPLGVEFIGAPGRPLSEAEASAAQTRAQVGKPVTLELRYDAVEGGAREARAHNAQARLDAFAGRAVAKRARPCATAGVDSPGLACTLVEFKGPVSQKQIVNSLRVATRPATDAAGPSVIYSEFTRAIFARLTMPGDTRNFPPITTDSEVVVRLAPDPSSQRAGGQFDVLRGELRLIDYLNPMAPLYFAAGKKSVSINAYQLTLTRLPAEEEGL